MALTSAEKMKKMIANAEADFQKAIEKAAIKHEKKFQEIIQNFLDELNNRYKRHCFIFTDSMGCKSIDMYHRVSGKHLATWHSDGDCTDDAPITPSLRCYGETNLGVEISDFTKSVESLQVQVSAGYYFYWEGKQTFDHVTDKLNSTIKA